MMIIVVMKKERQIKIKFFKGMYYMTEKQTVKDFLNFLEQHPDSIINTENHTYTYSTLMDSIIKTLSMAYGDGELKGFNDCQEQELFDKTLISEKEDW